MQTRHLHVYAGRYVERASELRKDDAWLSGALADPATRFVPVWRQKNLVRTAPTHGAVLLERERVVACAADTAGAILLGHFHGTACFAVEVDAPEPPAIEDAAEFADLRMTGGLLPADEAGLLAYARAMVYWRQRHRYCGSCGAPAAPANAGHVMRCTNPACGEDWFPRIDPAIIVLVADASGERALLGRQASWPQGRYSTIAGFVEPGESLEDAVAREVAEETGVEVAAVDYHSSQPWPFPSSLMVGFLATASEATGIALNDGELQDARWFTRAQIANGEVGLPPPTSISYRLIAEWYDRAGGRRLVDEPGVKSWLPPRR